MTNADLDLIGTDRRRINHLDVRCSEVTDQGLVRLAASPFGSRLTALTVRSDRLTDESFRTVGRFPALEFVHLASPWQPGKDPANAGVTGSGLVHLNGSKLKSIGLGGSALREEHLPLLAGLPELRNLYLVTSPVTDAGLAHVGRLTRLNRLYLQHNPNLTDAGIKHLEGLQDVHQLLMYMYSLPQKWKVTPAALASVGKLKNLNHFEFGDLPATDADLDPLLSLPRLGLLGAGTPVQVTDAGLMKLAKVKTLTSLTLSGPNITAAGAAAFRAARPDVTLVCDADKK